MKTIYKPILLILMILTFRTSIAQGEQREIYTSASFLARGGAMVADVDDYNALFVNPAGLPLVKEPNLSFEFQVEGSKGLTDTVTAFFGKEKYGTIQSEEELNNFRGQNNRAKLAFLISYVKKDFAFSFATIGTMDTDFKDAPSTDVDVFSAADLAIQFSYGKGFLEKEKLRFGGTVKIVYRSARAGLMNFTELNTNGLLPHGEYTDEGIALSFDIGSQYTWFRNKYDISAGFAVLDLATPFNLNPKLMGSRTGARPPSLPVRLGVGIGFKVPNIFEGATLRANLDFIKSLANRESSVLDIIHLGIDLKFSKLLSLRTGLNQMYWTAGIGIKYCLLEVSFATYAENTGIYSADRTRRKSNRRYLFQFTLNF